MTLNAKQWFIFRHGLATLSKAGYGDRIITAEVLPEGIPPIRRLGQYLKTQPYHAGYCSAFLRCQQTAAIVTEITGRTFKTDPRLNEQVEETFDSVKARVRAFVSEVQSSPDQHIWVCTHGIIIAALKHLITRGDFSQADALDYTQPGQILHIQGDTVNVLPFDDLR